MRATTIILSFIAKTVRIRLWLTEPQKQSAASESAIATEIFYSLGVAQLIFYFSTLKIPHLCLDIGNHFNRLISLTLYNSLGFVRG